MEVVKLKLFVTHVYTFTGIKYLYALGDMSYGEWLIYKNNKPRYYLDAFEDNLLNLVEESKMALPDFITSKLKLIDRELSLKPQIFGIRSSRTKVEWVELEKIRL